MLGDIKKIIITGDVQRPTPGQETNVRWLYHLLEHQLKVVTGVVPEILLSDTILSVEDWAQTYLPHTPSWHMAQKKVAELGPDGLIIGFEMPKNAIDAFENHGVRYIDFVLHPVRFMDDIVLALKTNRFPMSMKEAYFVNGNDFEFHACMVKARFAHTPKKELPTNTALFVGQTSVDRSLLKDGRVCCMNDYRDRISQQLFIHSSALYKPHPDNDEGDRKMFEAMGVKVVNGNIYELLANPQITKVCAISSSVLQEAPFFGKEVSCFGGCPFDVNYIPVTTQALLSYEFWADFLETGAPCITCPGPWRIPSKSDLRRLSGSWQGYKGLE